MLASELIKSIVQLVGESGDIEVQLTQNTRYNHDAFQIKSLAVGEQTETDFIGDDEEEEVTTKTGRKVLYIVQGDDDRDRYNFLNDDPETP